jgi:hypothetical protein
MMGTEDKGNQPKRGAMFESVALTAAAVAFGFVTLADLLSHAFEPAPSVAMAANKLAAPANGPLDTSAIGHAGIDYNSTGSIVSLRQAQHVDPCQKKD